MQSGRSVIVAGLLAALIPGGSAAAQQITSPYEFVEHSQAARAFASYMWTDQGALDLGPRSAPVFGLGYNVRVSGPFTLDVRLGYFASTRDVYDTETGFTQEELAANPKLGLVKVDEADLSVLIGDAAIRFDVTGPRTWYKIQPFALIGVGGALRLTSDDEANETLPAELRFRFRNGFTGHVGGGLEWHPTERFTLSLSARDMFWKLRIPDGFILEGRVLDSESWVQNPQVGVGLSFRF